MRSWQALLAHRAVDDVRPQAGRENPTLQAVGVISSPLCASACWPMAVCGPARNSAAYRADENAAFKGFRAKTQRREGILALRDIKD